MAALKAADRELVADLVESRPAIIEGAAETFAKMVAASTILVVLMVFIFIAKEAWPVFAGQVSTARGATLLAPEAAMALPKPKLAEYLGQPLEKVGSLDTETLNLLVGYRNEELLKLKDPETKLNTASWSMLLLPYAWQSEGHTKPQYVWQPNSNVPKFNIMPLLLGSAKISLIAILIALPLALGAALYVSQVAHPTVREVVKPVIELLAGFPSVVLGFFGLMVLASLFQGIFGQQLRLNSLVAGACISLAVIPILFTIAEDALSCVPKASRDGALAMGASLWYAAITVVIPAAAPGILAAIMLAFGRALGETMIALMCSGNSAVMGFSIFDSARTIPATIGQELAETAFGGVHYGVLFLIGSILFVVCFLLNVAGDLVIHRLKDQLQGKQAAEKAVAIAL